MKIKIPENTRGFAGGGSTFIRNFSKSINKFGHQITDGNDFDIYFIAGATLAPRDEVIQAKKDGKKIILRVDNILEDRKNRNSGMPKLRDFADLADVIVYQSEWAKRLLSPLLGNGIVIINGVDTDIFYPRTEPKNWDNTRIMYSKHSRNETKQFHEVQYWWREYNLDKRGDTLVLFGKFSDDYLQIAHPFDFHNDEDYEYKGVVMEQNKLADIIRGCDVAFLPYMYDACSNTVLECQACGLPVIFSPTGGTDEIVYMGMPIQHSLTPYGMTREALANAGTFDFDNFKNKYGLETMGEKYHALFTTISGNEYEI